MEKLTTVPIVAGRAAPTNFEFTIQPQDIAFTCYSASKTLLVLRHDGTVECDGEMEATEAGRVFVESIRQNWCSPHGLQEAAAPFAEAARAIDPECPEDRAAISLGVLSRITVGDLRRLSDFAASIARSFASKQVEGGASGEFSMRVEGERG